MRERAVRLVVDSEGWHGSRWQAIASVSARVGCAARTLNEWSERAGIGGGRGAGVPSEMAGKLKAPERESREPRRADEILRKASACFAQAEQGRRSKT